jgi:HK97 family phage portal protein
MFTIRHPRTWFRAEERSIDKMDLWGKGLPWDLESSTGISVSRETAARFVAVYACVRLRSEGIGMLPASVYRKQGTERVELDPLPFWIRTPNPDTNWFEFVERVNTSLDLDGNAYVIITGRDRLGFPSELWTLHPDQTEPMRDPDTGELFYLWNGTKRLSRFGQFNPLGDVLHIRNVSWGSDKAPSPIGVAREAVGLGLAAERFGSRFFGSGQQLSGVIQLPAVDGGKSAEFVKQMKEYWQAEFGSGRSHLPGVLTGGATWTPISINPEEAQFLETRKFQVTEIARLYGIPPHMIGDVEKSTSWGTGIEQQSIGFVQYSLQPRLARLEAAFNQLLPRGQFIKWNVNALLRGDSAARAAFYASGIQNGWLTRSEPRELEDLPRIAELDKPAMAANIKVLGEEPVAPSNGAGDPANLPVPVAE